MGSHPRFEARDCKMPVTCQKEKNSIDAYQLKM